MKKTLLVTLDFYPKIGGVANYYFNLCKNLPQEKIIVLTDGKTSEEGDLGFKIFREELLKPTVWPHFWPMFGAIKRIIRQEKIEMLWGGDIWPTGIVVFLIAKLFKIPYIISCHGRDLLLVKKSRLKKYLVKNILRRAFAITVNSKNTGDIIESFDIEREKIKVVYPGINQVRQIIDTGEFHPPVAAGALRAKYNLAGKKILLSIGRLVERKGFDKVIEAMGDIGEEVQDIVYVIVGDGPDKMRLEQESKKSRNQKINGAEIIFAGQVNDEEKWAWLDVCDVFIMPVRESKTDVEGFGIVYLEAALAGKPAIAGKSGGASEAVIDGETGLLVSPEDRQEIADAVAKLFRDEELRKKMGERGKWRAEKYFNWTISGKRMEEKLS
jgi:phosphatidyl-myo-inositol dimannoside synthase